jgi:hypothetical protein
MVDDDDYLFDTVLGGPSTHTFQWTNIGETPTNPLRAVLSGDKDNFQITEDDCTGTPLQPMSACVITVSLFGDVASTYDAELRVFDEPQSVSMRAAMSGKVGAANIEGKCPMTSATVVQGHTEEIAFEVRNTGGASTGWLNVSTSGTTAFLDGCTGRRLAGGEACTITAMYTPPLGDTSAGVAHIEVSTMPGGMLASDLLFTVIKPGMLQVEDVDFGMDDPFFATRPVTVTNPGPVTAGPIALGFIDDPDARISFFERTKDDHDGCTGKTLPPGGSCTTIIFPVTYTGPLGSSLSGTLVASAPDAYPGSGALHITTTRAHISVALSTTGTGSGTIDPTLSASAICLAVPCDSVAIPNGGSLQLTATPATGSVFAGWTSGGACSGTSPHCKVSGSDNADLTVQAIFNKL